MWIFEARPLLGEIRYSAELNMNSVTGVFPEIFKTNNVTTMLT